MGIAQKALTSNASFIKDLGLDSLDFAELLMELERVFSVNIPVVEVENLQTVQEAVLYIYGKLRSSIVYLRKIECEKLKYINHQIILYVID